VHCGHVTADQIPLLLSVLVVCVVIQAMHVWRGWSQLGSWAAVGKLWYLGLVSAQMVHSISAAMWRVGRLNGGPEEERGEKPSLRF
jgi:hypothetical protein